MLTLLVFIVILSVLIVVHEFGHFIVAKLNGVRVEEFSLGFGKKLLRKKKGGTEYSLSAIPLGGFVKLAGDNMEEYKGKSYEYYSKSPGKRFQIIFCGPLLNFVLGFLCFWFILFTGYPGYTTKVGGLLDGFGAKDAGIIVGDKIIAIDGRKVIMFEDLQGLIHQKTDSDSVNLSVLRGDKEFMVDVRIRAKKLDDQLGKSRNVGLIGIKPADDVIIIKHGFLESFLLAGQKTAELTVLTYAGLWRVITGKLAMRESVTGFVGMYDITSKIIPLGLAAILHFVAVLSVSLAVFNLLPLPVLDGGHILFLGIEKIRGKALGIKAERIITQAGFSFIIFLAVFVTYNDIVRIFGERISKFIK